MIDPDTKLKGVYPSLFQSLVSVHQKFLEQLSRQVLLNSRKIMMECATFYLNLNRSTTNRAGWNNESNPEKE